METTLKFALEFIKANTPGGGGGGVEPTNVAAQTGDFAWLFILLAVLALAAVLAFVFRNRFGYKIQFKHTNQTAGSNLRTLTSNKVIMAVVAAVLAICAVGGGLLVTKAFASSANANEDTNTIKVYIDEETGYVKQIDNAVYTNETSAPISIAHVKSTILDEAKSVSGLEDALFTVTSQDVKIYEGLVGQEEEYTAEKYISVNPGESVTLSFAFKDLHGSVAKELIGKTSIELSFKQSNYNTVKYEANGATTGTSPETQIKPEGISVNISDKGSLEKGSDKFNGWNTDAEGKGLAYNAGASYVADEDLTLYAQWLSTEKKLIKYQTFNKDEYDTNHGSVALNSSSNEDAAEVSEEVGVLQNPKGATATANTTVSDNFGYWNFLYWTYYFDSSEESYETIADAKLTPDKVKEIIGEKSMVTFVANFAKPVALYSEDKNEQSLTFKYTEDESVFENSWAFPVITNAKINLDRTEAINNIYPQWYTSDGTAQCYPTVVRFEPEFKNFDKITSLDYWFGDVSTLASFYDVSISNINHRKIEKFEGLENLNTSNVESANFTFAGAEPRIPGRAEISNWESINAYDAANISADESSFTDIDISQWDTSKIQSAFGMFSYNSSLKSIKLPETEDSFSKCVNMEGMFYLCSSLESLKINKLFGTKAENCNAMFLDCMSLKYLETPNNFEFLKSCTTFNSLFCGCTSLTKIDLSNLHVKDNIEEYYGFSLYGTNKLYEITVNKWEIQDVHLSDFGLKSSQFMESEEIWYKTDSASEEVPQSAESIPESDITDKTTYRLLTPKAVYAQNADTFIFYFDHAMHNEGEVFLIDDILNTDDPDSSTPVLPEWFKCQIKLNGEEVKGVNLLLLLENGAIQAGMEVNIESLITTDVSVSFDETFKDYQLKSLSFFFMADSKNIQNFNFDANTHWDYVNTENLQYYFCTFGGFCLSSIANTMYYGQGDKIDINDSPQYDVSSSDTYGSKVIDLDLSKLNINNIQTEESSENGRSHLTIATSYMFANCTSLQKVTLQPIPEGNQSKTLRAEHMFQNCGKLTTIVNFGSYAFSSANYMFWNCSSLKEITLNELTNFNECFNMFLGCNNLEKIQINESWNTEFFYRTNLVDTWVSEGETPIKDDDNAWYWNNGGTPEYVHVSIDGDPSTDFESGKTYFRDPDKIEKNVGMESVEVKPESAEKGTVSPKNVYYKEKTLIKFLKENVLLVDSTVVEATPESGYEFNYWTLNGKKINATNIGEELNIIRAYEDSGKPITNVLQAHFKKAGYKAYAVVDKDKKMTFYYDDQDRSGDGTIYPVNPDTYIKISQTSLNDRKQTSRLSNDNSIDSVTQSNLYTGIWGEDKFEISLPSWYEFTQDYEKNTFNINCKVNSESIVFDSSFKDYDSLDSISMWFMSDSDNDQTFKTLSNLENINTTNLTNVQFAFGGLYLNDIVGHGSAQQAAAALSPANDRSKGDITYNAPFNTYGHSFERELNMAAFDWEKLNNTDWMFANCQEVETIVLGSNIKTSNLTSMAGMFNNCENCKEIKNLDAPGIDTTNVNNMYKLFQGCSHIETLNLERFDTRNIYRWDYNLMFQDCTRLKEFTIETIKVTPSEGDEYYTGWTCRMDYCCLPYISQNKTEYIEGKVWNKKETTEFYYPEEIPFTWESETLTVNCGTFTRVLPSEYSVTIKPANVEQGKIKHNYEREEFTYWYMESCDISLNTQRDTYSELKDSNGKKPGAILVDDNTYYGVPEPGYKFKDWKVEYYADNGTLVDANLTSQFTLQFGLDYPLGARKVIITANFDEIGPTAQAVLSNDRSGNGYFTFAYKDNVTEGQPFTVEKGTQKIDTTVEKVYTVETNYDDYNLPEWYVENSMQSYVSVDRHTMIPSFDKEFNKFSIDSGSPDYKPLTIVFNKSFKSFDDLQSMSCFFMQALDGNKYGRLIRPFLFDKDHFIGLENIPTNKLWNVSYMFGGHEYFNDRRGSYGFNTIDLSDFDINNINNLDAMFANCLDLETIIWPKGFTGESVTSMYKTFFNCAELTGDNLYDSLKAESSSSNEKVGIDTSNVENMSYMFAYSSGHGSGKITNDSLNLYKFPASFNASKVTNMTSMFANNNAETILFSQDALSENVSDNSMDVSNDEVLANCTGMFQRCERLTNISKEPNKSHFWLEDVKALSAANMFSYCWCLSDNFVKSIGDNDKNCMPSFDNCIDMYGMFGVCSNLTGFSPAKFDISSAEYMDCMFIGCENLQSVTMPKKIDDSDQDYENVVSFESMFAGCRSLTSFSLNRSDSVTYPDVMDANGMFNGWMENLDALKSIDLNHMKFNFEENCYENGTYNSNWYFDYAANHDGDYIRNLAWDKDKLPSYIEDIALRNSTEYNDNRYIGKVVPEKWEPVEVTNPTPYGNMFAGLSSDVIQTITLGKEWNGLLGESISPLNKNSDSESGLYTANIKPEYWSDWLTRLPWLWKITDSGAGTTYKLNDQYLGAGDICKLVDDKNGKAEIRFKDGIQESITLTSSAREDNKVANIWFIAESFAEDSVFGANLEVTDSKGEHCEDYIKGIGVEESDRLYMQVVDTPVEADWQKNRFYIILTVKDASDNVKYEYNFTPKFIAPEWRIEYPEEADNFWGWGRFDGQRYTWSNIPSTYYGDVGQLISINENDYKYGIGFQSIWEESTSEKAQSTDTNSTKLDDDHAIEVPDQSSESSAENAPAFPDQPEVESSEAEPLSEVENATAEENNEFVLEQIIGALLTISGNPLAQLSLIV